MLVTMKSRSVFHNSRILTEAGDGVAHTGKTFQTDEEHGKELQRGGLAYPVDPEAFDPKPGPSPVPTPPAAILAGVEVGAAPVADAPTVLVAPAAGSATGPDAGKAAKK